jgi:type VI secretion system protein ImpA
MSAVVDASPAAQVIAPVAPPPVVDVEALLAPIPGENPVGESQAYSGLYDEIREARRSDDNLEQGDWQHEAKTAEWPKVVDLSTGALAAKTKDFQVCAWLGEALVELYGFVGLRDALKVMRGLHEQFWDKAYPEIEDGDMDGRANAISFMDTRVEIPLKRVSLTKAGGGSADYSYLQWEDSVKFDIPENLESLDSDAIAKASELRAQAEAEGRTTGEQWRKAKNATRRAFYEETYLVLNQCWDEFQALDRVMDEKFGRQTPGLGAIKKALDGLRSLIEKIVKEKRILEPDPATDGASAGAEGEGGATSAGASEGVAGGPMRSRTDALRQLAEVAQYFQRTEPHSPVAYLVNRAIRWGQMPLELWLEDVIKDGAVLGQLKETLGLDTPTSDQNS